MKITFHTITALLLLTLPVTAELGFAEVLAEPELHAAASMPPSAFFGPVIERVINHPGDGTTNYFLDLDSGKFIEAPGDIFSQLKDRFNGASKRGRPDEAIKGWAQASGADLMIGRTTPEVTRVLYGGWISFPVHSFTKTDAQKVLRIATEAAQHGASRPPVSISNRPGLEGDAAVFFQTREGGIGLLQIVDTTESPRSVKIRYKLLVSDFPKTMIQNRDSVKSSQAFVQETPAPLPLTNPPVVQPKAEVPGNVTKPNLEEKPTRPEQAQPPVPTKAK